MKTHTKKYFTIFSIFLIIFIIFITFSEIEKKNNQAKSIRANSYKLTY